MEEETKVLLAVGSLVIDLRSMCRIAVYDLLLTFGGKGYVYGRTVVNRTIAV